MKSVKTRIPGSKKTKRSEPSAERKRMSKLLKFIQELPKCREYEELQGIRIPPLGTAELPSDPDLDTFGQYRIGLTDDEIKEYLRLRVEGNHPKKALTQRELKNLFTKFGKAAGCNTVGVGPEGQSLMYRHDVQRFADQVLLGKETYFD